MFKINNLIYQSKIKLKEVVSGYSHYIVDVKSWCRCHAET